MARANTGGVTPTSITGPPPYARKKCQSTGLIQLDQVTDVGSGTDRSHARRKWRSKGDGRREASLFPGYSRVGAGLVPALVAYPQYSCGQPGQAQDLPLLLDLPAIPGPGQR